MNKADYTIVAGATALSVAAYLYAKRSGRGLLGLDNRNACMFLAAISAIGGTVLLAGTIKQKVA